jgi:hypothetical protein
MLIRLTRKLANHLDGIDVTDSRPGDLLELPDHEAQLLLAEAWAVPHRPPARGEIRGTSLAPVRAVAADARSRTRAVQQARRLLRQMENTSFDRIEQRRADDQIREALHDEHLKPIR